MSTHPAHVERLQEELQIKEEDFERFLQEEAAHLKGLQSEPMVDVLKDNYVRRIEELDHAR